MSSIASKNLYDLLGNDPEQDPELREPEPPTKAIDKATARTGKRNAPAEAPARAVGSGAGRGGQRDSRSANENAFRDRGVGHDANRSRGSGVPGESGFRGGRGRGRGGRRGGGPGGDRHSRTGVADHEKQVSHGWGGQDGGSEWADEKAGEAIAKQEEKEEGVLAEDAAEGADGEAAPAEPEDKTKSFAAYLAEQAEKKLSLAAENVRKPNEGSSKKFPEGKAIARDDDEDSYIVGSGGKSKREREKKAKTFVELDDSRLHSAPRETFRGGRGGRGRGEFRGGEGRGRGGRGRGEGRGRGGRGGPSGPNIGDSSAFPSLGS